MLLGSAVTRCSSWFARPDVHSARRDPCAHRTFYSHSKRKNPCPLGWISDAQIRWGLGGIIGVVGSCPTSANPDPWSISLARSSTRRSLSQSYLLQLGWSSWTHQWWSEASNTRPGCSDSSTATSCKTPAAASRLSVQDRHSCWLALLPLPTPPPRQRSYRPWVWDSSDQSAKHYKGN